MARLFAVLALAAAAASSPLDGAMFGKTSELPDLKTPSFDDLKAKYMGNRTAQTEDMTRFLRVYTDYIRAQNYTATHDAKFDLTEYWNRHPEYAQKLFGMVAASQYDAEDGEMSLLQVGTGKAQSACEVCVYVVENKEQHQPFLCRGLKAPSQQQTCVSVLVSLMWWLENQVYWVNYGCQRSATEQWEWVKPCPAHAICSFIQSLYDRSPFCPNDPSYRKPSA